MHLYLTSFEPSNSSYCNQEGDVLFKSICVPKASKRTTVIWRALPSPRYTPHDILWKEKHFVNRRLSTNSSNNIVPEDDDDELDRRSFESHDHDFHWDSPIPSICDLQKAAAETELLTSFRKVAEIEFHAISSTIIRHGGGERKTCDFFKKEGWAWYGGNRIFTGPDQKQYMWKMGSSISELFLLDTDISEEHGKAHVPFLVARYHCPRHSVPSHEKEPPCLEIFKAGEHMTELILITFIYIEEMRRQRQKLSPSASPTHEFR
ncbi:hypothetical protein JR316_0002939 [Psilocybe cubensis]|uniref:DUF6593 domain-containing protein n=2 Tax=Psilocybe cubensis TaxID=181762 RepID=A0A8H7Y4M1_PSICU|nr:hypothetical protein JR316_0002939 [Psilocybe cubensis]KAH9483471.1 hypothetical protein JR316_0002939 [Psilocybe cubensis]